MIDTKLITFIQVAKWGSYTKAADAVNLTQPAVTQHIKQLEEYYGVTLIRKQGRHIALTEEGELLLKRARELEAKFLVLCRELKNKSAVVKRYNIGATLTIGEFVLPNLLGGFKRLHGNIDIIMQVHNLEEVLKRLNSGELDLGIVEGPFDKSRYCYKKLKDDELVLAAAPQSIFAGKDAVEIGDIVGEGRLIMREKGSGTRMVFENKLYELGYDAADIKIYMEVGSIGAIKSLVAANLGCSVISREAIEQEAAAGSLTIVPIRNVKIMREFNFVYLNDGPVDFIESFTEFLTTSIR